MLLKFLKYLIFIVTALFVLAYLYVFREQDIRVDFIPSQFKFFGERVSEGDTDYDNVVSLLKENKSGWETSVVSYVPNQIYDSPSFKVNILENVVVVVSYKTGVGYPQFVKKFKHDLGEVCQKYN
ncbi:hypothetical protein A7985_07575 [Pseudoalteromonas luteoviolacea]|uniref:Uncharacterized protein n=1 Tax=Pseudoalteromonas luteoviolacea TaxID=43657 RepID=A0A1C0TWU4_9GAMM|nr:hypothetical protein [Pseudoalteromonas luteoviolacea]OCQ23790.1 hypothetical protein A7985_07575 [Pseudoalteromonas luteoviolacea]